jgi:hypothetical protein
MRHLAVLSALCVGLSQLAGCLEAEVGEEELDPEILISAASDPTTTTTSGTIVANGWITKQITLAQTSDVSAR